MKKLTLSALLLGAGLMMAVGTTTLSAKCGGEAKKCGASKSATKCGGDKATKCGSDKKAASKCGGDKAASKCGSDKKAPKASQKCGTGKCA